MKLRATPFPLRRLVAALLAWLAVSLAIAATLDASLAATARADIDEKARFAVGAMRPADFRGRPPSEVKAEIVAALTRAYGLDLPPPVRILRQAGRVALLDLGVSESSKTVDRDRTRSVRALVLEATGPTLVLFTAASLLALALGLPLGLAAARRPGSRLDRSVGVAAMLFFGTPAWWIGSFLVSAFALQWRIFPFGALHSSPPPEGSLARLLDAASYLVLPALSIAFVRIWGVAYVARSLVLPASTEDFVMSARARGIPEARVFRVHVLGTAAPAVATWAGLSLVMSLAGDALVEIVFARPGIGLLIWRAVRANDVPLAAGGLAVVSLFTVLAQTLLDLLYGLLDPRVGAARRAEG